MITRIIIERDALKAENAALKEQAIARRNEAVVAIEENRILKEQVALEEANGKYWSGAYRTWVETNECARKLIELKEQVAQARYTNAVVYGTSHPEMYKTELDYAKETIEQQAEALRVKDEALKEIDLADDDRDFLRGNEVDLVAYALAIQPNPDILRERDARLVERMAEYLRSRAHSNLINDIGLRVIADQIRKGTWK